MKGIPSLNALRAFEAVARHMNFTKAAGELCVTQSAVSRQVMNLEDELSIKLFSRIPNKLALTEAGMTLYHATHQAFKEIVEAKKIIENKTSKLRLISGPTFATRWLIPRLHHFSKTYPDVQIEMETSTQKVDFRYTNNFDAAISYGIPHGGSALIVERLMRETVAPICSPQLLAPRQSLERVDELSEYAFLHSTLDHMAWKEWSAMMGITHIKGIVEQSFESEEYALQAALSGLGITFVNLHFVQDLIDSGSLIPALPDIAPLPLAPYCLVYHQSKSTFSALSKFRSWLLDVVSTNEYK